MAISDEGFRQLAAAAYTGEAVPGWRLVTEYDGGEARVYVSDRFPTLGACVFRGTQSARDVQTDIEMVFGADASGRFRRTYNIARAVANTYSSVVFCGHSLGATLALAAATAWPGSWAWAFSPFLLQTIPADIITLRYRMKLFVNRSDPVSFTAWTVDKLTRKVTPPGPRVVNKGWLQGRGGLNHDLDQWGPDNAGSEADQPPPVHDEL